MRRINVIIRKRLDDWAIRVPFWSWSLFFRAPYTTWAEDKAAGAWSWPFTSIYCQCVKLHIHLTTCLHLIKHWEIWRTSILLQLGCVTGWNIGSLQLTDTGETELRIWIVCAQKLEGIKGKYRTKQEGSVEEWQEENQKSMQCTVHTRSFLRICMYRCCNKVKVFQFTPSRHKGD